MGNWLDHPGMHQARLQPRTFDRLAPAGRATTLLTRRAWPTAAQTAIVGAFTAPHHTLLSALPADPRRLWVVLPRAPLPANRGNPASAPQIAPPGSLAIDGLRRHFLEGR